MEVPIKFRKAGEVLANFSYQELASGTGYITFYLVTSKGDKTKILSESTVYSSDIITTGSPTSDTPKVKEEDLDFDIIINKQRVIAGLAVVNIPFGVRVTSATGSTRAYIIAKIRHWDGSTETELGSAQGDELVKTASGGSNTYKAHIDCLIIDVAQKIFKSGDTLRITIELWAEYDGAAGGKGYFIAHDPKNRDDGITTDPDTQDTNAIVHIPFKIIV